MTASPSSSARSLIALPASAAFRCRTATKRQKRSSAASASLGSRAFRFLPMWPGARSDAHGTLPHPPTSYLKKIYFDSVVFTPYQLAELVRLYGADHVIMGTDYPFDMADYDPIGHVASAGMEETAIAAVAGGNAK